MNSPSKSERITYVTDVNMIMDSDMTADEKMRALQIMSMRIRNSLFCMNYFIDRQAFKVMKGISLKCSNGLLKKINEDVLRKKEYESLLRIPAFLCDEFGDPVIRPPVLSGYRLYVPDSFDMHEQFICRQVVKLRSGKMNNCSPGLSARIKRMALDEDMGI